MFYPDFSQEPILPNKNYSQTKALGFLGEVTGEEGLPGNLQTQVRVPLLPKWLEKNYLKSDQKKNQWGYLFSWPFLPIMTRVVSWWPLLYVTKFYAECQISSWSSQLILYELPTDSPILLFLSRTEVISQFEFALCAPKITPTNSICNWPCQVCPHLIAIFQCAR